MLLKNSYLISIQKDPILCEINNLFFWSKAIFADRKQYKKSPLIEIAYYDRLIAPIKTSHTWLIIGEILQRTSRPLGGSVVLNHKWVQAKNTKLLNKYQAYQKTRIISSSFFKYFSRKLSKSFGKHFFCLTHNPEKKTIFYKQLCYFRSLPKITRLEMSNKILDLLITYSNKRLDLLTDYLKNLNAIFYNAKEISSNYLIILNNEVIQTANRIKIFDDDLLTLTPKLKKFTFDLIYPSRAIKDSSSYINQSQIIRTEILKTKCEFKNGYGSFNFFNQLKLLKQKFTELKKSQKKEKLQAKKILKSWIKGLKAEKRINRFEIFLELRKYYRVFLKLKIQKAKFSIKIAKKILGYKNLTITETQASIKKINAIIEESFSHYDDVLIAIKKTKNVDRKNSISKDAWANFLKNQKQNIFYWNKQSNDILFEFGLIDLDLYSRNLENLSRLKWLIKENQKFANEIRFNHHKLMRKTLNVNNHQDFMAYQNIPNFQKSCLQICRYQMLLFNKLANHSFKVAFKSKNNFISTTAYGQNLMYREIVNLHKDCLEIQHNSNEKISCPSLLWLKNYFIHLANKIFSKYQVVFETAELELTNQINFPRSQNDLRDSIKEIKDNFKNVYDNKTKDKTSFIFWNTNNHDLQPPINLEQKLSFNPYATAEASPNYANNLLQNYLNKKQYKDHLLKKIQTINKNFFKSWKLKHNERKIKFKKFRQSFKNFSKYANLLLRNIKTTNKFCAKTNLVLGNKKPINDNPFVKLYGSNVAILKRLWWYYWALKSFTSWKTLIQRRKCYKYLTQSDLCQTLKDVGLNELILFSNPDSFTTDELLRLYLVCQFTVNPKILIYLNLPITTKNQYNFVKGLLLKEQNRTGLALIFLESSGEIANDLGMKFLPTF